MSEGNCGPILPACLSARLPECPRLCFQPSPSRFLPSPRQWLIKRTAAGLPSLDRQGRSALHYAVLYPGTPFLRWLLETREYKCAHGCWRVAGGMLGGGYS